MERWGSKGKPAGTRKGEQRELPRAKEQKEPLSIEALSTFTQLHPNGSHRGGFSRNPSHLLLVMTGDRGRRAQTLLQVVCPENPTVLRVCTTTRAFSQMADIAIRAKIPFSQ